MTWNHRIVRFKQPKGLPDYLEICEVYYDDQGNITAHTENGVSVGSETIEGLKWVLEQMLACLGKEIVEEMK